MMMIKEELSLLKSIAKGIVIQYGERCEVAIYELSEEKEQIIFIENPMHSGRKIGDKPGEAFIKHVINKIKPRKDNYSYIEHTSKGRIIKTSVILVRNNKDVIGAMSIDLDITDIVVAENALKAITSNNNDKTSSSKFICNDINDFLDSLFDTCTKEIGRPGSMMSKEEKIKSIAYLDEMGAFLVTKAGDKMCDFFNISKFTLYNYLDFIRGDS